MARVPPLALDPVDALRRVFVSAGTRVDEETLIPLRWGERPDVSACVAAAAGDRAARRNGLRICPEVQAVVASGPATLCHLPSKGTLMTTTSDWARPHYAPDGGDALVAFWVFGDLKSGLAISAQRHRARGVPPGVEILRLARRTEDGDSAFAAFTDGDASVVGRALDEDPELARVVRGSDAVLRILGTVPDPENLGYLRDTIGIVQAMLEAGAVGVADQAFHWWSAETWGKDVFAPDRPLAGTFVNILGSEEESGDLWLHTRGMRLFGRPDLSVRGVTEVLHEPAVAIVVRFMNMQMLGGVIPDGQAVRVAGIPDGWVCAHTGDLEDPDFNNVHVEIGPSRRSPSVRGWEGPADR